MSATQALARGSVGMDPASDGAATQALVAFMTNLRGRLVVVQLADGTSYEALFARHVLEGDALGVELKYAQKQISDTSVRNTSAFLPTLNIKGGDLVSVTAKVTVGKPQPAGPTKFATDTEISRPSYGKERELVAWAPSTGALVGGLDDAGDDKSFDQFETHARMVKRTQKEFDLDDYSTPIDKNSEFYRANEAYAARKVREINNSVAGNAHIAEERGLDTGLTDDQLYSQVLHDPSKLNGGADSGATGRYVPPHARQSSSSPPPAAVPKEEEEKKEVKAEEKPKSKLNPNAKPFKLSAKAAAFVPSFAKPKPQPVQQQQQQQQQQPIMMPPQQMAVMGMPGQMAPAMMMAPGMVPGQPMMLPQGMVQPQMVPQMHGSPMQVSPQQQHFAQQRRPSPYMVSPMQHTPPPAGQFQQSFSPPAQFQQHPRQPQF